MHFSYQVVAIPDVVYLGNIAFLKGDAKLAVSCYERAEQQQPDHSIVLLGLARANHELENYGLVQDAYAKLKKVDSKLAQDYTYLDLRGVEATKAASITEVLNKVNWVEK